MPVEKVPEIPPPGMESTEILTHIGALFCSWVLLFI